MIKVCSLNFLNDKEFKTDVKTADGVVLYNCGEQVTPEIILKLYFKEIYIDEESLKKPVLVASNIDASIESIESEKLTKTTQFAEPVNQITEENIKEPQLIDGSNEEDKEIEEPKFIDADETSKEDIKEPNLADVKEENQKNTKGPRLVEAAAEEAEEEEVKESPKGPKFADNEEEKEDIKGPKAVEYANDDKDSTKGPRLVETEDSDKENTKGPKRAEFDFAETDDKKDKKSAAMSNKIEAPELEEPVIEINPDELPLEFDEAQAKRIVKYSLTIGKMLSFSAQELKDLEKVAYYCNIGITNFKRADLNKKGFRQMKAFASYEKLLEGGTVSIEIAEMVKSTTSSYESEIFPLDLKVPYSHIVAITSYYEDLLAKNNSKEDALLKMLQIGGNKFNIFALHKFIKMMRDTDG